VGLSETAVRAAAGWSSGAMVARYTRALSGELAIERLTFVRPTALFHENDKLGPSLIVHLELDSISSPPALISLRVNPSIWLSWLHPLKEWSLDQTWDTSVLFFAR